MTCGEGHNQIAKAIKNSLDTRSIENKIIQLFGYSEKETEKQNKLFLRTCKLIPHLYDAIWRHMRNKPLKIHMDGVIKQCKDYVLNQITEFDPEVIICTHNYSGAVVAHLKEQGLIKPDVKTYTVVFDYCLCPYWETNAKLDYAVLPHELLIPAMKEKGFTESQLLPFGFPVDKRFTVNCDKVAAREELGIDREKFTVVLYSGGNCVSSAYSVIKELLKCKHEIQIIAVCGRNKKEFEKIQKLIEKENLTNILNIGFCTYLDKVFSAGDVVFTRGGGGGLTEQINKHIPLVLREKLIINEKINKELFAELGLGMAMNKLNEAAGIVDRLIENKELLKRMSEKSKTFCKPNATGDFVEHVLAN